MNATKKLLKAKVQLILNQPFFATIALRLQYITDTSVKTAVINGLDIKFNPEYIEKLSVNELTGLLAHEIMHITLLHHIRRNNRSEDKWNIACDYAINPLLIDSGFSLPNGYLFEHLYKNMSAEQIYSKLPDSPPNTSLFSNSTQTTNHRNKNTTNNNFSERTGDVTDLPIKINKHQEESALKQLVAQAFIIAQKQGKLPAALQKIITETLQPKVNWKETLARFITETTKNDYTWKKPASRYQHMKLYLPALETEEVGKIILIIDTSGSINKKIMNQLVAEVNDIATAFNTSLLLLYVDTKVQGVQHIDPDGPLQLCPIGGGGTDFRPGFSYIEKNELNPKTIVYLTDGRCSNFPKAPDYPVLWAQYGKADFKPPFGEITRIQ